jgi:hypothetical protein
MYTINRAGGLALCIGTAHWHCALALRIAKEEGVHCDSM